MQLFISTYTVSIDLHCTRSRSISQSQPQAKIPQAATSLVIPLSGVTQNFIHFLIQTFNAFLLIIRRDRVDRCPARFIILYLRTTGSEKQDEVLYPYEYFLPIILLPATAKDETNKFQK